MGEREKKARQGKGESETSSLSSEDTKLKTPIADASSAGGGDGDDDDEAEANEDLSLKIIEKAMQRVANQNGDDLGPVAVVSDFTGKSEKKSKGKENRNNVKRNKELNGSDSSDIDTNFKSFCGELFLGDDAKEQKSADEKVDGAEELKPIDKVEEPKPVEASDNMVLRRLLRGPRYFDPPDSGWGTCYKCGEEGHAAVNCTAPRRKKPCFVCGSLEHNAKQCTKGKVCYMCKKEGHRARDCPDKNEVGSDYTKICLKCGDDGHDLFSCRNSYDPDDLKEVQCYVCGSSGHLCCAEYTDTGPRDDSCYKCGVLGHTGLACMGSRGETSGAGSLSLCFRCGEEGHFARECISSAKVGKRNRELSTPKKKTPKESGDYGASSMPSDLGKSHKKKKIHFEDGFPSDIKSKRKGGWSTVDPAYYLDYEGGSRSGTKTKRRGGWITEDPVDFPRHKANGRRSPATPSNKKPRNHNHVIPSHTSRQLSFSNSASYESSRHQHRFGNGSRDWSRRNYDWQ